MKIRYPFLAIAVAASLAATPASTINAVNTAEQSGGNASRAVGAVDTPSAATFINVEPGASRKLIRETPADINFRAMIAGLQSGQFSPDRIETVSNIARVQIVPMGRLAQGKVKSAVDHVLKQNSDAVLRLRHSIGANTELNARLQAQSIRLSSVVAANISADNEVIVYVE